MPDALILELDGYEGESQIKGFEKKIEILSFSHGVAMQVTGDVSNQERTSGKPNLQDLTVSKYMDKSSTVLKQACAEGKIIKSAKLFVLRNDAGSLIEMFRYELENPVVSSYSTGAGGGDKPVDTLTLNFAKVKWVYTVQGEGGAKAGEIPGQWDIALNTSN